MNLIRCLSNYIKFSVFFLLNYAITKKLPYKDRMANFPVAARDNSLALKCRNGITDTLDTSV